MLNHQERNVSEFSEAEVEALVSLSERLLRAKPDAATASNNSRLAIALIEIYDNPWRPSNTRERAAHIVAKLADRHSEVLALVMENAQSYARTQHLDDAFPYSPNGFEVLAEAGPRDAVVTFLRQVVCDDWGVVAWTASEALAALEGLGGQVPELLSAALEDLRAEGGRLEK